MTTHHLLAPPPSTLDAALRTAVQRCYQAGKLEDITVRRIRRAVEIELGLEEDFFKGDGEWKERSKGVISGEVARVEAEAQAGESSSRVVSAAPSPEKKKATPLAHSPPMGQEKNKEVVKGTEKEKRKGVKRKVVERGGPKKRRKKIESDDDDDDDDDDEISNSGMKAEEEEEEGGKEDDESPVKATQRRASSTSPTAPKQAKAKPKPKSSTVAEPVTDPRRNGDDQSESEMSVLIDEPPKSKGRPKKQKSATDNPPPHYKTGDSKKPAKKQQRKSIEDPADPDQEEIKRLQGWLVKCGIRKMWWKELQPFETSKAKIKHLKGMLAEAGMTGRYSQEKASQVREERELRADLEAVTEGAKIWGRGEEGGEEEQEKGDADGGGGRSRRKVAKGLELDFLNSEDGEETD